MKKITFFLDAALLIAMCGGCAETVNDKTGGVFGKVTSTSGTVQDAAVLLTPGGGTKITGSDGSYEFYDLQPGKYELKIYKEGFQSFNKSIDVTAGKEEELAITLTASSGKLAINKAYIDMGGNESNNVAGFSIVNSGTTELAWSITNAAKWITKVDPQSGSVGANSSTAVVITIDRSKLSNNSTDNHATLVVSSTSDGSTAELLVTVFGSGDGTNTTIGDGANYVVINGLCIQTQDASGNVSWTSANDACETSTVGGFDDWRLPSIGELGGLYMNNKAIGGFNLEQNGYSAYWSSSPANYAYRYIQFYDGTESTSIGGSNALYATSEHYYWNCRCRCVRQSSPTPQVTTLPATNVTTTSATLNGQIVKKGEPAFTERGFVYSNTFQNPSVEDDDASTIKRVVSGTSTDFSANVSGLESGATYHVRAYAINSNGTVYGESINFKAVPDYVMLSASGIMVQKTDISGYPNWTSAQSLCAASGVGGYSEWRLPTIGELSVLYTNRTTIGGFKTTSDYWSSTIGSGGHSSYSFSNASQTVISNESTISARCVRTLP